LHELTTGDIFSTVIGKGGEQINKLQSETGARVQVAPGMFVIIIGPED
jgi:polyribonucleotide nucleotidyltransferase